MPIPPFGPEGVPSPSPEALFAALNTLRRRVDLSCLEGEVTLRLLQALEVADRMLAGGNFAAAADSLDRFVLVVQRYVGSYISLSKAVELADIAIVDLKRFIADPAQVFTEAVPFAQRILTLEMASNVPLALTPRRIPPGVPETVRGMSGLIRSYRLPPPEESRLLDYVEQMGELALQFDPLPQDDRIEIGFLSVLGPFKAEIVGLEASSLVTRTQVNRLFGIVVFGWPTWLCGLPKLWPFQIIAGIVAGIIIYVLLSDPKAVKTAAANISNRINTLTANTNRRLNRAQIQAILRAETAGLSLEELRILKKRLATSLDSEKNNERKGIYRVLVDEIEKVIDERLSGIEPETGD